MVSDSNWLTLQPRVMMENEDFFLGLAIVNSYETIGLTLSIVIDEIIINNTL